MQQISKYTIQKKIGSGGMATVYLATDNALKRPVALKILHPHLTECPETLKRFSNEAKMIATLSHENIIKLFDFGEAADTHYLVMEYVEGRTLADILDDCKTLPNLVLIEVALQLFSGLHAAHERGIFHRDIKPANIMIDNGGCVKLTDFGVAYLLGTESITLTGAFVGSPNYVSPEHAEGKPISAKSDIFSAGVVLYQCAAGAPPFTGENLHAIIYSIVHGQARPPWFLNRKLLFELGDLIELCLAKNPEQRPDTHACVREIERICAHNGLHTGRSTVASFLAEPEPYRARENAELLQSYRDKALANLRDGNSVSALKCFDIAGQFGDLSAQDRISIAKLKRQRKLAKAFAVGVAVLAVLFAVGSGARSLWKHMYGKIPTENATASPKADTEDTAKIIATIQPRSVFVDSLQSTSVADVRPWAAGNAAQRNVATSAKKMPSEYAAGKSPYGYLGIKTKPPYVQVFLDGDFIGESPLTRRLPLKPGKYELRLKHRGCKEYIDSIMVTDNDTLVKNIAMERYPAAK